MIENETRAHNKLKEAEKKLKKSGCFFCFLNYKKKNMSDACNLYVEAANIFKIAKNWKASGQAFLKAAELHLNQGNEKVDSALRYSDAANSFRKIDTQKAIDCFSKMIEIYIDMGKFDLIADGHIRIAELYEERGNYKNECINHYQEAFLILLDEFNKGEELKKSGIKCLLKIGQIFVEMKDYEKAIEIYEEVANIEAYDLILNYSIHTHFFKALLCYLCLDLLKTQQALKSYEKYCPSFSDSYECKFIKDIITCLEEKNVDKFNEVIKNYDKISPLEPWYTTIFLTIKQNCDK